MNIIFNNFFNSRLLKYVLILVVVSAISYFSLNFFKTGVETRPADNSVLEPMKKLVTVRLNVEESGVATTLERFVPQIRQELNIDLRIITVPFAEKFDLQMADLRQKTPQYDIYVAWPSFLADMAPYLADLSSIATGGKSQVKKDLQLDDIHPAYLWTIQYRNQYLGTQIDGDVKLLNYRYDIAQDPKEKAAFKERFGYELDMSQLTWERYLDVAEFFTRPEENFYGTAEVATFFSFFYFLDRFHGMGGYLFDYDDMRPFPDRAIARQALQNGLDTFNKYSPPGGNRFGLQDLEKQLWTEQRIFMMTYWPDAWRMSTDPNTSLIPGKVAVTNMPGFIRDGELIFRPDQAGGRVLLINDKSAVKQAAYKVLVFFSDKNRTQYLVNDTFSWLDPWRISHLRPSLYQHLLPDQPELSEIYVDVLTQSTANGYPALRIPGTGAYHKVIEHWVSKIWQGDVQIEHGMSMMIQELESVTDRIGRDDQLKAWREYVDNVLKPANLYP